MGALSEEFNLLISTMRGNQSGARYEILRLLREVGDGDPKIAGTEIPGLIVAKTNLGAFEAIRRLRNLLIDKPWVFRSTLKIRPIEKVVKTSLEDILEAALNLATAIAEEESFMIKIDKRLTNLKKQAIVEAVAAKIERKVDLRNPDKILLIEILGGVTGLSLIGADSVLSVVKEKKFI